MNFMEQHERQVMCEAALRQSAQHVSAAMLGANAVRMFLDQFTGGSEDVAVVDAAELANLRNQLGLIQQNGLAALESLTTAAQSLPVFIDCA